MADKKDILVGLTVQPDDTPEVITESFDGESENVNYSKLTSAFADLKTDLQKHYRTFSQETVKIKTIVKPFN